MIISPAFVYLTSIVNSVRTICVIMMGCGVIGAIVAMTIYVNEHEYDDNKETLKKIIRIIVILIIITIINTLILVFLPNKETLIEMKMCEYITTENISWTVEQVKEIIDYVANCFK